MTDTPFDAIFYAYICIVKREKTPRDDAKLVYKCRIKKVSRNEKKNALCRTLRRG